MRLGLNIIDEICQLNSSSWAGAASAARMPLQVQPCQQPADPTDDTPAVPADSAVPAAPADTDSPAAPADTDSPAAPADDDSDDSDDWTEVSLILALSSSLSCRLYLGLPTHEQTELKTVGGQAVVWSLSCKIWICAMYVSCTEQSFEALSACQGCPVFQRADELLKMFNRVEASKDCGYKAGHVALLISICRQCHITYDQGFRVERSTSLVMTAIVAAGLELLMQDEFRVQSYKFHQLITWVSF